MEKKLKFHTYPILLLRGNSFGKNPIFIVVFTQKNAVF